MEDDRPRLRTPDVEALVALADPPAPRQAKKRAAMITGMRRAAEKRVAGVTSKKRRRHYGHAAFLAVMCVRADGSAETKEWLEELEKEYRRFPALRRELEEAREELLGRASGTSSSSEAM